MGHLQTHAIAWDRVAYLERQAAGDGCGAVVTFVGVVRGDRSGTRRVRALYYEAYDAMAERQIDRWLAEANARWSLNRALIQHRLGFVEVGHIGVAIVVAAQHRALAYAASQFLIEQIKHEVPIWKVEHYDDGTSRRVACAQEVLDVADPAGAQHAHV